MKNTGTPVAAAESFHYTPELAPNDAIGKKRAAARKSVRWRRK